MIVHKVDIRRLAILEAENDPPIGAHGQRPKPSEIAFQRMQPKGRIIEIGRLLGGVQQGQYLLDLAHMLGIHAFGIVVFEKLAQSFVPKILDPILGRFDKTRCKVTFYTVKSYFTPAASFVSSTSPLLDEPQARSA